MSTDPGGWSYVAPFAVRRPAHRLRYALASTRSRGRCHAWTGIPLVAIQLSCVSSRLAWSGERPSSSAKPAPRSSSGAPISQAEPSTAGSPPMIGATEPSSPTAWPVSVRYPGSSADWEGSGSCPGRGPAPPRDQLIRSGRCRSWWSSPSVRHSRRPAQKRWCRSGDRPANPGYPIARLLTGPRAALQPAAPRSGRCCRGRRRNREVPCGQAGFDGRDHRLGDLDPGPALVLGLDQRPRRRRVIGAVEHLLHRRSYCRALLAVAPVLVGQLPGLQRIALRAP